MPEYMSSGKKLYYEVNGESGDYLFLLNGLMMTTKSWLPLTPTLVKHYRVVTVDLHDMGQSEKMTEPYKHDVQVEAVYQLMRHLGLEKAHLCGTSYGGTIALQFALKYPEHCDKIMVFNTLAYADKFLTDVGNLWKKAALTYDTDNYYDEFAPFIYAPWYYEKYYKSIYQRKEQIRPFINEAYLDSIARLSDSTKGYDLRSELGNIKTPVLVVGSDEDYLTPLKQQHYLKNHLPNSEFVLIPDSGHGAVYEKSLLIVTLMLGWFKEIEVIPVFTE